MVIGERPTVANLKLVHMKSLMRGEVRVTAGVLQQGERYVGLLRAEVYP